MKRFLVALLAGAALVGGAAVSQAQINFTYTTLYNGSSTTTSYDGGNGGTYRVDPFSNPTFADASGFGATIHLVTNTIGLSESASSQSNVSSVSDTNSFFVTINQQGGGSGTFTVPVTLSAQWTQGTNTPNQLTGPSGTIATFSIGPHSYTVNAYLATDAGFPPIGAGTTTGTPGDVTVHITAVGPPTSTPEPGTWAMFATSGIGGLLFLRRRRA